MNKVKINFFDNLLKYQLKDGFVELKWDVDNCFFVLIFSQNFFHFFKKSGKLKTLTNKIDKITLIAIGLFSYESKTIKLKPLKSFLEKVNYGRIHQKKILNLKSSNIKNYKFKINDEIDSKNIKKSFFKLKTIKPKL
tara:strand:- start:2426 stop:2836 length:411 start_codon:yes stop_codon:yes gene_type:complete